ncbi:MAG: DNA-binding response regulator [Sphingobacteriales bacterium 50-39]|nr:MAG: DNA-binding response regulator [Sphingobacteriales bacterium 50-39]
MMNCIAVDDERLVLDLLVDNISKVPFLRLVGRCRNAMEAMEVLHKEPVDLIFLDIQMPGLNGLQFISSLPSPPMVIFITAYKEHALEGFNLNAVDYLLKPVAFERFLKACNKAQELYDLRVGATGALPDYFFVYVEYNLEKISIPSILYIEGMKDYVKVFMEGATRPLITKMSMKAMEEKLAGHRLARIHRSYIVHLDKITSIRRDLLVVGKAELPVSDSYRPHLEELLRLSSLSARQKGAGDNDPEHR